MTTLNNTIHGSEIFTYRNAGTFVLQIGRRALSVGRDFRKRYYETNPVIGMYPGIDKGHLEVLLFRRWVLVLARAS